jgi:hypothetical protein
MMMRWSGKAPGPTIRQRPDAAIPAGVLTLGPSSSGIKDRIN